MCAAQNCIESARDGFLSLECLGTSVPVYLCHTFTSSPHFISMCVSRIIIIKSSFIGQNTKIYSQKLVSLFFFVFWSCHQFEKPSQSNAFTCIIVSFSYRTVCLWDIRVCFLVVVVLAERIYIRLH